MERMRETHNTADIQGTEECKGISQAGEKGDAYICISLCVLAEKKEPLESEINLL